MHAGLGPDGPGLRETKQPEPTGAMCFRDRESFEEGFTEARHKHKEEME